MPRVAGRSASFAQRLAVDRLAAHEDIHHRDGHVEQALVVDLWNDRLDFLNQSVSRARYCHDVTRLECAAGVRIDEAIAPADALDKDAQAREQFAHRLTGQSARSVDTVRTDFDVAVR